MSLTSKIKNDKNFQETIKTMLPKKEAFNSGSGKKAFSNEYVCFVESELDNSNQSSLVGIAFDYLARLKVAKIIASNRENAFLNLNATKALKLLGEKLDKKVYQKLKKEYVKALSIVIEDVYNSPFPLPSTNEIFNKFQLQEEADAYTLAIKNISKKKEQSEVCEIDFLSATILMAKLEQIYRTDIISEDIEILFDKPNKNSIANLRDLYALFDERFLKSGLITEESFVIFNPSFGKLNSLAVGGADADIYIDGVLYEFKTTKNKGYKWQDVAQLINYYLLHLSAIEHEDYTSSTIDYMVNTLAFYKARYGEIEYLHINDLDATQVLATLKKLYEYFGWEYSNDFDEYYRNNLHDS